MKNKICPETQKQCITVGCSENICSYQEVAKHTDGQFREIKDANQQWKPILIEQFSDNGEHSHWHLYDPDNGHVLWSDFSVKTMARGWQEFKTKNNL